MSKTKILMVAAALAVVSGGCSNPYKYMSAGRKDRGRRR